MLLNFNIIYTKGTVKQLSFFVHGLLRHSDCIFRLVANGCSESEIQLIRHLCRLNPRLNYLVIPTKTTLPHGAALNYLQATNKSKYFCFMDSDIFASGEFVRNLAYLDGHFAGVFSCSPIWQKDNGGILGKNYQMARGRYHLTETKKCIGNTYLAIYDNQILSDLMYASGLGFDNYNWTQIPENYRIQLTNCGLNYQFYNTGKVLNILLSQKYNLIYRPSPTLHHIGGVSVYNRSGHSLKNLKKSFLNTNKINPFRHLFEYIKKQRILKKYRTWKLSPEEIASLFSEGIQKNITRSYFIELIYSLHENKPLPAIPITGDYEIEGKIRQASTELVSLYNEYCTK